MTDGYKDINIAKLKLIEMSQQEEKNNRPYFVENDFWDNQYTMFPVKEREVEEWKRY